MINTKSDDIDTKFCKKCKKTLSVNSFRKKRATCRSCEKEIKKESDKKTAETVNMSLLPTEKKCKVCQETKNIEHFRFTTNNWSFRNKCKSCEHEEKKETLIPKAEIKKNSEGLSRVCQICGIEKNLIECYTINGNNYRNQCDKCRT